MLKFVKLCFSAVETLHATSLQTMQRLYKQCNVSTNNATSLHILCVKISAFEDFISRSGIETTIKLTV
jgi:hypothetical protein